MPWRDMPDPVFFERRFQAKFLVRLALLFALGTSFLFLVLFIIFSRSLAGEFSGVFHALRHFAEFLFPIVAVSVLAYVLLVCGAVVILGVFALHKVAGPIYRMERALEGVLAGDPVRPVFFRQGDQAHPLAAEFNAFVAVLREDRKRWAAVLEHADRLCLQDQATCLAEREEALAELESLLSKYR